MRRRALCLMVIIALAGTVATHAADAQSAPRVNPNLSYDTRLHLERSEEGRYPGNPYRRVFEGGVAYPGLLPVEEFRLCNGAWRDAEAFPQVSLLDPHGLVLEAGDHTIEACRAVLYDNGDPSARYLSARERGITIFVWLVGDLHLAAAYYPHLNVRISSQFLPRELPWKGINKFDAHMELVEVLSRGESYLLVYHPDIYTGRVVVTVHPF